MGPTFQGLLLPLDDAFLTGNGHQEAPAAGALAQPHCSVRLEVTVGGPPLPLAAGTHHG
jgi:hypothetical protein